MPVVGMSNAQDPVAAAGRRVVGSPGMAGSASNQRRTFALVERLTAAYNAWRYPRGQEPANTDPTTLDTGSPAAVHLYDWQEYFRADNTRLQVCEDVDEMDETADEVSAALDILSDAAVNPEDGSQHTFVLEIDEGRYRDQAEAIFDQVTEALDLHQQAFSIARDFLKYGDTFLELIVDESGQLARGKILPPKLLWRNEDDAGNIMRGHPQYSDEGKCLNAPGECAFDEREQLNGRMMAAFEAWQIVHFRWNRRGSDRYGRSMMRTARLVWKKLRASEEALVVARLQRAWMRFAHYVDTTGMDRETARAELMRYRQELTRRFVVDTQLRDNPFEVTSDFYVSAGYVRDLDGQKFLPKKAEIQVLQGDHAVLAAIHDIEYFQNKLFASLRVPKAYLGFERDINAKATLSTQDIQFARTLRRVQGVLSMGYKGIFDFALILNGINPAEVSYSVRWPVILVSDEERDANILSLRSRADAIYWQMGGVSTKYITQQRYGWDDEAWEADLLDAQMDPPARLRINPRGMPSDQELGQTTSMATDADAAAAAMSDSGHDSVTDTPPDDYDESMLAKATQRRAAANRGRVNPTMKGAAGKPSQSGGSPGPREAAEEATPGAGNAGVAGVAGGGPQYGQLAHGLGAGQWGPRRPGAPMGRTYHRELSVPGVHGLLPTTTGRRSAWSVRSAAQHELEAFLSELLAGSAADARHPVRPTR